VNRNALSSHIAAADRLVTLTANTTHKLRNLSQNATTLTFRRTSNQTS